MTHWKNPWEQAVPVPLDLLASCVAGGNIRDETGKTVPYDADYILKYWASYGDKLDGYLLQGMPGGHISAGVRFGPEGPDYLSPYIPPEKRELAFETLARSKLLALVKS